MEHKSIVPPITDYRKFLETNTISTDILKHRRHYFINMVKAPLIKVLVFIANKYPEPTRDNTRKRNTHALLDIWDEFFEYEHNGGRDSLFRAIRKVIVGEYEHDAYYSQRIDWFLKKLVEKYLNGKWNPPQPHHPASCWTEPSAVKALGEMKQELMRDVGIVKE